jgi:hypothetical protein
MPITKQEGNVTITQPTPEEEEDMLKAQIKQYQGSKLMTTAAMNDDLKEYKVNAQMYHLFSGDDTLLRNMSYNESEEKQQIEQLGAAVTEEESEDTNNEVVKMHRLINCLGLGQSLTSSPY